MKTHSLPVIEDLKIQNEVTIQQTKLAENSYQLLLKGIESINDYSILILDVDGHIMTWNKGAETIEGYTAAEIIGQSFKKFYKPEAVASGYPDHELKMAKEQGRFEDEGWRVRKDGSTFLANVIITPIFDEQNNHLGFTKVTRDLTKRNQAEERYKRLEQGINKVTDYAIFLLDTEGNIQSWNKGAENIKGYTATEIIGQSFKKFYKPEAVASGHPDNELKVAKEHGRFEDEGWRVRKDGSTFWANIIITPIFDEYNNHTGFTKVTQDLTERKRAEERLQESIKQEQLMRMQAVEARINTEAYKQRQAEFIAVLSHELRNPLSGIVNSIELLEQEFNKLITNLNINYASEQEVQYYPTKSIKEYIESIKLCAEQQKVIVDDVLDVSKIERNKIELNEVPFNAGYLIATQTKMFAPQIAKKQLSLVVNISEANLWVKGDAHRLTQVITNLLTNAIKFTETGSIIIEAKVIECNNGNASINFSIADTGVGMSPGELEGLFNYFHQATARISTKYGGSGLGLFLSKKLVELMGGVIQVESKKWHGTRFNFSLSFPTIALEQLPSTPQPSSLENQRYSKQRQITILVVEDNTINQKILVKHLTNMGYLCCAANNGNEAVEQYNNVNFDLILMDIEMPIMDGLEATQIIRAIERSLQRNPVPIIGLSGNALSNQVKQALDLGMNDYITKPYHLKTLSEKLSSMLNLKESAKFNSEQVHNSPTVSPGIRLENPFLRRP